MAISTTVNRVAYQGNGSSALFNFGYQIQSPSDLAVFAYNSSATAPQIITPYVLNAAGALGYVFSGTANASGIYPSGGNIVLNSSPNAQSVMVIFRSSVVTNAFFVSQDGKISSTGLNNELDKLTIIAQRAQDIGTRSLRLPDGFYGTFDPTLPANVALQPGKQIIINSTATGLALGNDIANYLPNMLLIASGTSVITSLPGATAGLVLQSNGSSAPSWGTISLGCASVSAGQISGVLNVGNGGTGTGTGYINYALIFASNATTFGSIDTQVTPGMLLTANSSAPPSFQAFSATSINSGVIAVGNGGTGTGSSFNQYGVVFGESTTKLASTGPGGNDQPLIGNTGAAPSYRALNIASNSSITGVLAVANGGTGANAVTTNQLIFGSGTTQLAAIPAAGPNQVLTSNGSSAPSFQQFSAANVNSGVIGVGNGGTGSVSISPQYGILYASSTSQVGIVPSAAAGTVLTANGSSAPTFQAVTVTPIAPSTKTANYNATTSDQILMVSSSNFTINLYGATGNAGRLIKFKKTDTAIGSSIVIAGSNANINGALTATLNFPFEELELFCDGTNWFTNKTQIPFIPSVQVFNSGAVVYNTPTGATYLRIRALGGGGGGGNSGNAGNASGSPGAQTIFGSSLIICGGGLGGPSASSNNGGAGGTSFISASIITISTFNGSQGGPCEDAVTAASAAYGGDGGCSPFGGGGSGGASTTGASAVINSGSGGGGAGANAAAANTSGGGGGSGGYAEAIIWNPAASYSGGIIGDGGAGATAGTGGSAGGKGGSGKIIVEAY